MSRIRNLNSWYNNKYAVYPATAHRGTLQRSGPQGKDFTIDLDKLGIKKDKNLACILRWHGTLENYGEKWTYKVQHCNNEIAVAGLLRKIIWKKAQWRWDIESFWTCRKKRKFRTSWRFRRLTCLFLGPFYIAILLIKHLSPVNELQMAQFRFSEHNRISWKNGQVGLMAHNLMESQSNATWRS